MTKTYKIAEKRIRITSIYDGVHELCRDYTDEGEPDFSVEVTQSNIDYERERSAAEDRIENIPTRTFSDKYLETLAVYRQIAERMLEYDTLLFHGSVVAVDGEAYLFTAKSGTGKSTHTRLWREYFGERAVMVNDDKPLIKITDSGAVVFGTPWDGKHRMSSNIAVPLKAVCILERAENNRIETVDIKTAYPMLLQQSYRPKDQMLFIKTLELLDTLSKTVGLYKLGCNMDIQAAEVSYNGMKGKGTK